LAIFSAVIIAPSEKVANNSIVSEEKIITEAREKSQEADSFWCRSDRTLRNIFSTYSGEL
jgi:hypothetical protein